MSTIEKMRDAVEYAAALYDSGSVDELYAFAVSSASEAGRLSAWGERARAMLDKADARIKELKAERDKLRTEIGDTRVIAEEAAGLRVALDEACARVEAIAVERNVIISELGQTTDAMMRARAERDEALARPCVGHPTPVERAAHIAAGGEWVMLWRHGGDWRCYSTSEHSNTVADAIYIATRDGLPCAWPEVTE